MRPRDPTEGSAVRPPALGPRSPADLIAPSRPPRPSRDLKPLRPERRLNGFFRFINGALTFTFVILALCGGLALVLRTWFEQPGPLANSTVAIIPKGDGVIEIAGRLEREGIVSDRRIFMVQYYAARLYGGLAGDKSGIKAGEYEIKKQASMRQVLDTLVEGRAILQKFTVPEGLTSLQIVERMRTDQNLTGDIVQVPPEGTILPNTYRFSRGLSRQEILDRMLADHQKLMAELWERRQPDLPFQTLQQAMVLASIVEKETGRGDERDRVAAVFVNRLRKNMRLQSDPTIVYGLVGGQGPLGRPITRSDIDSKTPYNTYQIDGLPPGPICNPGRQAIEATLNPAKTSDLYFVADGSGGHVFTATLKDHNAAVQNWRKYEREQKAKQSGQALPVNGPANGPTNGAVTIPLIPPSPSATDEPAATGPAPKAAAPAKKAAKKAPQPTGTTN